MNCKSFDKLIQQFIENKGDIKEAKDFLNHLDNCSKCKEEFESDFYAFWGVKMLNNPDIDSYNIGDELENTINSAKKKIRNDRLIVVSLSVLIIMSCIAIVYFILLNDRII